MALRQMKLEWSLVGLLLIAWGCDNDQKATKLQYMPDMADAPVVEAQEGYLDPPPHAIARESTRIFADPDKASERYVNTLPANEENLAAGKKFFGIYCGVCHGQDGKGNGTLTNNYPKDSVPDITRSEIRGNSDGWYMDKILRGGALMPSYAYATEHKERWQIIMYLRSMQK